MAGSHSNDKVQRRHQAGLRGGGGQRLLGTACLQPTLSCFPLVWQSRGAGPEGHPGSQRHQRRRGPPRPARPHGLPGSTRRAWHHRETWSPGTSFPLLRAVFVGIGHFSETDGRAGAPSLLTDLRGDFRAEKPVSSTSGSCAEGCSVVSALHPSTAWAACTPACSTSSPPRGSSLHLHWGAPSPQASTRGGTQWGFSMSVKPSAGTETCALPASMDRVAISWPL